MKIACVNLRCLPHLVKGVRARLERFVAQAEWGGVDVLTCQELFQPFSFTLREHPASILHRLLKKKGFRYMAQPASVGKSGVFSLQTDAGLAIYSRRPITPVVVTRFHHAAGTDAYSSKGCFIVSTGGYFIGTTHCQASYGQDDTAYQAIRRKQFASMQGTLQRLQKRHPGTPIVMTGDFNTVHVREVNALMRLLHKAGMQRVPLNRETFGPHLLARGVADKNRRRELLDHIFYSHSLCCVKTYKRLWRCVWGATDHYMLTADIAQKSTQDSVPSNSASAASSATSSA